MNNKDFLLKLSQQSGNELDATSKLVDSVLHSMVDRLQNGDSVVISGFGSFEVKKKMERISVNPVSRQRLLIPPKLVVGFKPSSSVKEEVK
ncbi:MAG: HU family DNA-binding protein [Phocaeicola sp.]|nr:HU family DNA-binding protein [Phocaeicola sp.]